MRNTPRRRRRQVVLSQEALAKRIPFCEAWSALLQMGPSERTQGWFPKQFDHGTFLLDEPIKKVRTFQSHVVRLAMETDMWAARCRMIHPDGTTGSSPRKFAADEYAATLERTRRKHLPVTKRIYMGLPTSKWKATIERWEFAFPTPVAGPLDSWLTSTPRPAKLS